MEDLYGIQTRRQAVQENIEKAFSFGVNLNDEVEKARSGIYADTAENRKLNRVGQQYGGKKQVEKNIVKKVVKLGGKDVNLEFKHISEDDKNVPEYQRGKWISTNNHFSGAFKNLEDAVEYVKEGLEVQHKMKNKKEEKVKKEISKVSSDIDSLGYYLGDNPDEDESGNTRDWSMKEIIDEMLKNKDIVSGVKKLIEKHGVNETYKQLGKSSDAFNAYEIKRIVLSINKKSE